MTLEQWLKEKAEAGRKLTVQPVMVLGETRMVLSDPVTRDDSQNLYIDGDTVHIMPFSATKSVPYAAEAKQDTQYGFRSQQPDAEPQNGDDDGEDADTNEDTWGT